MDVPLRNREETSLSRRAWNALSDAARLSARFTSGAFRGMNGRAADFLRPVAQVPVEAGICYEPGMAHRLSPSEEALLARYRERLLAAAPKGTVKAIIVFGSRARGKSGPNSDLDVAVMISPEADRLAMRRLATDIGYDLSEEMDLLELGLAPLAIPTEPRQPLHNAIDRDGIVLWAA